MTRHILPLLLALALLFTACQSAPDPTTTPTESAAPTTEPRQAPPLEPSSSTATLYVGTQDDTFAEYPMVYQGDQTPELLISGLEALTGWDLSLADSVYSGKDGISVTFDADGTLFTLDAGDAQAGFRIQEPELLARTILDSIQATLQRNFVLDPSDPAILDIWYALADDQPLSIPQLDKTWPLDQPYQWELPLKRDSIPFEDGQLYAVAHMGYQVMEDIAPYTHAYLDESELALYEVSHGDFYLVIPRYRDMTLRLYQNDLETGDRTLLEEIESCPPFLIQCNVSDIFPDVTMVFTHGDMVAEYSPFLSLEDGSLDVGACGLDITIP